MITFSRIMEHIGTGVDVAGVLAMVAGMLWATWKFLRGDPSWSGKSFRAYRQNIGRSILLGLEFLVAGDIIRTVVVAPTLENVLVLGCIVLIRTFLSTALQLEVEGHWPWQKGEEGKEQSAMDIKKIV